MAWTRLSTALVFALPAGLCATACPLDDRALQKGAEWNAAGAGGGDSFEAGAVGGMSGAGGTPAEPIPTCDYAKGATQAECDSLVDNPGFEQDFDGWNGENSKIVLGWDSRDAMDSSVSGSLGVANTIIGNPDAGGTSVRGAEQCVKVSPGGQYQAAADVFIPDDHDDGMAGLGMFFYQEAECEGATSGSFNSDLVDVAGQWKHLVATWNAPGSVKSMSVRLIVAKPFEAPESRALFDNVLVQLK